MTWFWAVFLMYFVSTKVTANTDIYVCNSPLGLDDGRVKDSQLSATSYKSYMYVSRLGHSYNMKAKYGRLNDKLAWCGLGPYRNVRPVSYFQIDFGAVFNVTGLATQGFEDISSYYVKTYNLSFSLNRDDWFDYSSPNKVWQGNNDGNSINRIVLSEGVRTRYLRIYPQEYNIYRCLRVEVYGCRSTQIGHPTLLPSTQMTSPVMSATRTPAIHGSQQYTNDKAKTSNMEISPSQSSYTPSSLAAQTKADSPPNLATRSNVVLLIGICIGAGVSVVIIFFLFVLLRKNSRVRGVRITSRKSEYEIPLKPNEGKRFANKGFV